MDRRSFLRASPFATTGLAAMGIASSSISSPAIANSRRRLTIVAAQNVTDNSGKASLGRFVRRVFELTDGAVEIVAGPAGAKQVAEMNFGLPASWTEKSPAWNFFSGVPFGLTSSEFSGWLSHANGQALLDEIASNHNIKAFQVGSTGAGLGGWFRREIRATDDFRGLKIHMPGLGGDVLQRLGATLVDLDKAQVATALRSRLIDATAALDLEHSMAANIHQAAEYLYRPGWQSASTNQFVGVNLDVWASLRPSQRLAIESSASAETAHCLAQSDSQNATALMALLATNTIQLKRFSNDILIALAEATARVLSDLSAQDPLTRRVHDSYRLVANSNMQWHDIARHGYVAARALLDS